MTRLVRRLKYWFQSGKRSDALREEMQLHLEERTADLIDQGFEPNEAKAEARRRFGNVGLTHESSREVWINRYLQELAQDLHYSLRTMASNKAFSTLVVLSLALGIGANTAIYSFMEAILMRSLPVKDPESLAVLNWKSQSPQNANKDWVHVVHGVQGMLWPGDKGYLMTGMFPFAAFENLSKEDSIFSTLFGYFDGHKTILAFDQQAMSAKTEYVTGGYFKGLSIAPAAGRLITPEDDRSSASPVAVISFATSQTRFGGPANAIGKSVQIDKVPFTVIGVTPPEFFGVDPATSPDLYLPLRTLPLIQGPASARMFTDQNFYWLEMMGRLRPGVSMYNAQSVLAPRFHQWVESTASSDGERAKLPALVVNPGAAGLGSLRREYSKPLYVLLAMVLLILTITCANIANLLLARASARRRELAIRLSLGAGRFRLVRQLLTESVTLALFGGALGVLFAIWGVQALTLLFSKGQENFTLHAELNWQVLTATTVLSLLCGLLFGLAPAIQSTRPDVTSALKNGRAGGAGRRSQQLLVVAQIAMSFLLLFVAGLFVRTLDKLHSVQLGYSRENILLFSMNARQAGHRDPEVATFYTDLRKRLEAIPGVTSASLSHSSIITAGFTRATIGGPMKVGTTSIDGARVMVAGSRFLTTMQIPLLAGREIDDRDQPGSTPVAVITEQLARKYFGNENPLGRRIRFEDAKREFEIIGVAANLRNGSLKQESSMTIFIPVSQVSPDGMTFALRTTGDPLNYVSNVREIVRQADASIPLNNIMTQAAEIDRSISREILFAKLCTGFALLALLTAGIGLYGTMSYNVTRQASEIGIRMALEAQQGTVAWMVLRRVLALTTIGLAVSIPVALIGSRLLKSLLFNTQPNDPITLAIASLTLVTAAILAGYGPARRASRMDPLVALRRD